MNDMPDIFAPPLPLYASLPIILLTLLALLPVLIRLQGRGTRYVLLALWLRVCADALQPLVLSRSPLGLSWNALISIGLVCAGLLVIRPKALLHRVFIPVFILIPLGVISGVVAGAIGDAVDATTRLLLLLLLALAMQQALEENGDDLYRALLVSFVPLFLFQAASGALGAVKASEADGSRSIIGGFMHEGPFSLLVVAALFTVVALRRIGLGTRLLLIGICMLSLILANYRTTILASLPLLLAGIIVRPVEHVQRGQRGVMVLGVLITLGALLAIAVPQMASRFEQADSDNASIRSLVHRPPQHFNLGDRNAMSGRFYIWSLYLQGWRHAPGYAKVIGSGPGQRPAATNLYAHNSFFAALYENGIAGLLAFGAMVAAFCALAFAAPRPERPVLLAGQLSMLILHLGTMPMWNVEGIMLFALVIGASLHAASMRSQAPGAMA